MTSTKKDPNGVPLFFVLYRNSQKHSSHVPSLDRRRRKTDEQKFKYRKRKHIPVIMITDFLTNIIFSFVHSEIPRSTQAMFQALIEDVEKLMNRKSKAQQEEMEGRTNAMRMLRHLRDWIQVKIVYRSA